MPIQTFLPPRGADVHPDDPEYDGSVNPGESFARGSSGSIVFDLATGDVKRYYVVDAPAYADIVRVDVASHDTPLDATGTDILCVGFWTHAGVYVPRAELE